ncbi:MAG: hypothetical protein D5R97_02160 [Candidatus Syntrophonatronum acetioxidans]|uniref:Bypass of forespore C C-terminal domain-containing protein n=1 Tax=Candidatus Syntrophonatronum acetioxidans TaxID=1795816 RepID=A0A424YH63_9FIRM|nr:MAG: hypothetical protein D5R97_02160 [Candidatus Syntrophonatronum acetioxidans]
MAAPGVFYIEKTQGVASVGRGFKRIPPGYYLYGLALLLITGLVLSAYLVGGQVSFNREGDEEIIGTDFLVYFQKIYRDCEHQVVKISKEDEEDFPEGFSPTSFAGLTRQDLSSLIPAGWEIKKFSSREITLHKVLQGACPACTEERYIGIFQDKIAIFQGKPPHGILKEITSYEVKEIYRQELEEGIPFADEKEKRRILESYTS